MMFFTTPDPVLTVQVSRMQAIDPQNPADLFGMWSVFSKASGILEHGRRFENLSWRLWTQQRLCEKQRRQRMLAASAPSTQNPTARQDEQELPSLSTSIETADSEASAHDVLASQKTFPGRAHSSLPSSLGREKELTTADLKNLIISIKVKQDLDGPLSPLPLQTQRIDTRTSTPRRRTPTPHPSSPRLVHLDSSASTIESASTDATPISPGNNSDTSEFSPGSDHSVVRGFAPGKSISTFRSQCQLAQSPTPIPILKTPSSYSKPSSVKKKVGLFEIGSGSSGSSSTMQENISPDSVRTNERSSETRSSFARKVTSFKEEVVEIPKRPGFFFDDGNGDNAIESDTEDEDEGSEEEAARNADDDDDAWQDEDEAEADEGPAELTFRRIDSKPDLVSRPSLLTLNLHGSPSHPSNLRQGSTLKFSKSVPALHRTRSSTPNGPSMPDSPEDESPLNDRAIHPTPGPSRTTISSAIVSHSHNPIMSPRDTRKTMLTQELGVSLRKHMLNERQHRGFVAPAPRGVDLPRRAQTSLDMRHLANKAEQGGSKPGRNTGSSSNSFTDSYEYEHGAFNNSGW